jgi:hypothetical protein
LFEAARLAAHAEAFCQRVRLGPEQADFRRKRELLELLIDRVIVTGEAVEIRYAIPVGPEGEREPFCLLRTDYQACVPSSWSRCIRPGRLPQAAAARAFLTAEEAALVARAGGDEPEAERLRAKLGAVMIERDLLHEKIAALEAGRPLGRRRPGP